MISQLKIYALGVLAFMVMILGFLLQNSKLKAKTKELKDTKKVAQIHKDVAKILANRHLQEVLDGIDKEISNGDTSSLDR